MDSKEHEWRMQRLAASTPTLSKRQAIKAVRFFFPKVSYYYIFSKGIWACIYVWQIMQGEQNICGLRLMDLIAKWRRQIMIINYDNSMRHHNEIQCENDRRGSLQNKKSRKICMRLWYVTWDLKEGHKEPDKEWEFGRRIFRQKRQGTKTLMLEGSLQIQRTEVSPG